MNSTHVVCLRRVRQSLKLVFVAAAVTALAACEHLPRYNKEKDVLAQSAQKTYTDTKVTEALDVQDRNLAKLLNAEIDVLNESASLRLDIALLRMSDDRPVADGITSLAAWYERAKREEAGLGFPNPGQVRAMLDHQFEVAAANAQIATVKGRISSDGSEAVKALPSCDKVQDADPENLQWKYAEGIEGASKRGFLMMDFAEYVKQCKIALKIPPAASGRVGEAFSEMARAEVDLIERRTQAKDLADKVKAKMEELKKNTEAAQKNQKNQKKLADAEKKAKRDLREAKNIGDAMLSALKELRDVTGGEGADVIAQKNIEAINEVLAALGSDQANAAGLKNERLKTAVTWIKENVPSLAADMAALLDQAQAPPVSNLILELQYQTIQQNFAKTLIALAERRIDMLRARYRTLIDAAGAWRGFRLALCNFAVLSSNQPHLGDKCDTFEAKPVNRDTADCKLNDEPLNNCSLNLTWRDALNDTRDSRKKRELYGALYRYAEAAEAERVSREAEFHLADLDHREVLAAQRSGIEAWNNLVTVPIGQLAAYYASGIKPEAVADAIAIVLGLTAVGVGAAQ